MARIIRARVDLKLAFQLIQLGSKVATAQTQKHFTFSMSPSSEWVSKTSKQSNKPANICLDRYVCTYILHIGTYLRTYIHMCAQRPPQRAFAIGIEYFRRCRAERESSGISICCCCCWPLLLPRIVTCNLTWHLAGANKQSGSNNRIWRHRPHCVW